MDRLQLLLREHMNAPFPQSVEKGTEYGGVDCVMADADIYGWANSVVSGARIPSGQLWSLERPAGELRQALPLFPAEAEPYYARLADRAGETIQHCP